MRLGAPAIISGSMTTTELVVRAVGAVLVTSHLLSCGGPWGPIAGGRLDGMEVGRVVTDWGFVAAYPTIDIETRPANPYSVKINYVLHDGGLFIEAGASAWSRWRAYLHADPRVRIRVGDEIFPMVASEVTDRDRLSALLPKFLRQETIGGRGDCGAAQAPLSCLGDRRIYELRYQGGPMRPDGREPAPFGSQ